MHQDVRSWLRKINAIDQLIEYVNLKSRSNYAEEVRTCSQYNSKLLENLGMKVDVIETSGNPVVFGQKEGTIEKSVLIYGHYDVQPEGDLDLWDSPPFEAEIRGNKLYGRGTADNKGQHFAHILALRYVKDHFPEIYNKLPVSVILDGDEERSSFSLPEVFENRADDIKADIMIVSDGPSLVDDKPTLVGSVRGIMTLQITIKHNPEDYHSGNYGGVARSAILDMTQLLAALVDEKGRSNIPGFYDNIVDPSDFEKQQLKQLEPIYNKIQSERGYKTAPVQANQSNYSQNQFWPTFNINGISGGGVKKQRRTIIPAEVVASIDCRLVPNMESDDIRTKIENFITEWAQERGIGDSITITSESAMEPVGTSLNDSNLGILQEALTYGFESEAVLVPRLGGSLPLYIFPKYLDGNVFLVPFALADENNHAPNENLDIPYFEKGVISMIKFYQNLTK